MSKRKHRTRREKVEVIDLSNPKKLTKEQQKWLYSLVTQNKFKKYNKNITRTVSQNRVDYNIQLTNDVLAYRNGIRKQFKKKLKFRKKKKLEHLWIVGNKKIAEGGSSKLKDIEWEIQLDHVKQSVNFIKLEQPLVSKVVHDTNGSQNKSCKKETKNNKKIHDHGKKITRTPDAKRREKGRDTRRNGKKFDHTHHIVMKKLGDFDLGKYIVERKENDLITLVTIARNISQSLYEDFHKHKKGMKGRIHNDIKPANIMLDPETLEIAICDLADANKKRQKGVLVYTRGFDALEIHVKGYTPTYAKDIYALGETFRRLFRYKNINKNQQVKDLIDEMRSKEPNDRPVISDILKRLENILNQLQKADPLGRSKDDLNLSLGRRRKSKGKTRVGTGATRRRHSDDDNSKIFGTHTHQFKKRRQNGEEKQVARESHEVKKSRFGVQTADSESGSGSESESALLLGGKNSGKKPEWRNDNLYSSLLIDGNIKGLWKRGWQQQDAGKKVGICVFLLITLAVSTPVITTYLLTVGFAKFYDACSGESSNTPSSSA